MGMAGKVFIDFFRIVKMQNQYQDLLSVYDELKELVESNDKQTEQFGKISARFEEKRQNPDLSIMVYGVYNAGKSTFINALIGKDLAETDDVPLTYKIDAYDYKSYKIYDTPGIDAPKDHEQVADEQLLKSDIVLFLANPSGVAEEKATLEKLLFLVKNRKKIFLVFNEKNELSDDDFIKLKDQTHRILQQKALEQGLDSVLKDIPIYRVNAKVALKGKLENKQGLVKASNINEIERAIDDFIGEIVEDNEIYTQLKKGLQDCIQTYIADFEKTNDDALQKAFDSTLKEVAASKAAVQQELKRSTKEVSKSIREEVEYLLLSAEGQDPTKQIEELADRKAKEVKDDVDSALREQTAKVADKFEDFEAQLPESMRPNIKLQKNQEEISKISDGAVGGHDFGMLLQSSKNMINELGKEGIHSALKSVKDLAPGLMNNVSNATLKNLSANIVKYAGPVISVLLVAWEWWQEQKQQEQIRQQMEEQRRARERQEAQIRDAARKYADDFSTEIYGMLSKWIDEVFAPLISNMTKQGEMFSQEAQKNSRLLAQLGAMEQKLTK